jgi:tRNA (guanine26-N2/guanine27-N2)-dimethyltransferase
MDYAGPLWLGKIADKNFCVLMEEAVKESPLKRRVWKILCLVNGECDAPITYYVLDKICDKLGLSVPSTNNVLRAMAERGYTFSRTHFNPKGIKSNISIKELKELLSHLTCGKF